MKRSIAFVLIALLLLGCLFGCGDVSQVQTHIGPSDQYADREIEAAMDQVIRQFRRHWDGCTLTDLTYDEARSDRRAEAEARDRGVDQVIILYADFTVDGSGGDGSLNPNSTYTDYQWILTRNGLGGWKLVDWGYG